MGKIDLGISFIKKAASFLKPNKLAKRTQASLDKLTQKNFSTLDNDIVQKGLEQAYSVFSSSSNKTCKLRVTQIDDIILKYNQCSDIKLKEQLLKSFEILSNGTKKEKGKTLDFIECALDSINSAEGLYLPLYNINSTVKTSFSEKVLVVIGKVLKQRKQYCSIRTAGQSEPRQLLEATKHSGEGLRTDLSSFENYTKYNPLETFLQKYQNKNPELIEYLYETGYINKQKLPALREFCKRINQKFGIKTFDYTFYDYNSESAYKIEKELEMFHKILRPKEKIINTLKISEFDFAYQFKNRPKGYFCPGADLISLPLWRQDNTMRHELTHAIDKRLFKWIRKSKLKDAELEKNLAIGGAPKESIDYSQTKLCEMKAVLGEFFSPQYSKKTKQFMVKNGLPKEILKLRDIDFFDLLIQSKTWDNKTVRMFKEIRNKLGGVIPQEVYQRINSSNPNDLKAAINLLKKQKNIDPKRFVEIYDCLFNIKQKKADIKYLTETIEATQKRILNETAQDAIQKCLNDITRFSERIKEIKKDLAFTQELLEQALTSTPRAAARF